MPLSPKDLPEIVKLHNDIAQIEELKQSIKVQKYVVKIDECLRRGEYQIHFYWMNSDEAREVVKIYKSLGWDVTWWTPFIGYEIEFKGFQ